VSKDLKIYFASDFHLGVPNREQSLIREKRVVRWLDMVSVDADEIYLLGDVWDFWFEYSKAVPKGYVRLLGKLAELSDKGIKIHFFTGNHDMWTFGYLEEEIGLTLHREPQVRTINGKNYFIGHGDGLGPGDSGYKFLKKIFTHPLCQWLFARVHPNFSFSIAEYFSRKSRLANGDVDMKYLGDEEWLYQFAKETNISQVNDCYIFGHRHLPLEVEVEGGTVYYNLGEWINYNSYGVIDGSNFELRFFESKYTKAINK